MLSQVEHYGIRYSGPPVMFYLNFNSTIYFDLLQPQWTTWGGTEKMKTKESEVREKVNRMKLSMENYT